jgi:hypothetical protein
MKHAQGMVLLLAICMGVLVTGMLLSVWHVTLILNKLNEQVSAKHDSLHQLEYAAKHFIHFISSERLKLCALKTTKHALCQCDEHHQVYDFEVFDLGVFQNINDTLSSSHHWLIKIWMDQTEQPIIQMRIATAVDKSCSDVSILSWQLLTRRARSAAVDFYSPLPFTSF